MIDAARLAEILLPGVDLRLVEPHLYSPYAPGEQTNSYDETGALSFYDKVACNRVYNRLVWGYSTSDYHSLCPRGPQLLHGRLGIGRRLRRPGLHRQDLRRL